MPGVRPKANSFVLFQFCGLGQFCQIQSFEYSFKYQHQLQQVVTLQFKTSLFVCLSLPGKQLTGGGDLF